MVLVENKISTYALKHNNINEEISIIFKIL